MKRRERTVLAIGCFDIFHYGHVRHLQASAAMGTRLVVGVTRNRSVDKGAGRPFNDERYRLGVLKAIGCVDSAFLCDTSLEALRKVKPSVFALGIDYLSSVMDDDREYCKKHGIRIRFTNEQRLSSTELYDRLQRGF